MLYIIYDKSDDLVSYEAAREMPIARILHDVWEHYQTPGNGCCNLLEHIVEEAVDTDTFLVELHAALDEILLALDYARNPPRMLVWEPNANP